VRYMLLIYTEPEADGSEMSEWYEYTRQLQEAGVMLGGDPLDPVDTAVTVRSRDGETSVTDGPFAETKEVLGGYYMIEVDDIDQAKEWAAKMPSTRYGSTEVRKVMDVPPM